MHMFDRELGFLGGHGIVGGQIPLATGTAFAAKYRGTDQVTLCYFGEAAVKGAAVIRVAGPNVASRTCQPNPHTKSAQSQNLVCERGASHPNLAKTDSNRDNVKLLGIEAKSNPKNLVKTEIRNLSLISTI